MVLARIHLAAKLPIRTATAATNAAPRPLPSSDNIKSNCNNSKKQKQLLTGIQFEKNKTKTTVSADYR